MRSPTIEWQVAGACNYDCSYCIQSKRTRRGRLDPERAIAVLDFFRRLPGIWEIKCSGGEAFAHPAFLDQVVPGLLDTPHQVSILTNFSAPETELERFASLTRGRLVVFSASLHLEHVTVEDFARKALWFRALLEPTTRFVVNQVVHPGREDEAARCRDRLAADGTRWFPQLFKTKTGVAEYADASALRAVLGDAPGPSEANLAPSYRGRTCWAGVDYLILDKDGDAWSCRTAKRHGEGHLGNVFAGTVQRRLEAAVCPWPICPCTVPANRGMIEGISRRGEWT